MNPAQLRIVILEDDAAHADAIKRGLKDTGMNILCDVVGSIAEYRQYAATTSPDIALVDLNLPDGRAIDILISPLEADPFPILVMTGHGDEQTAVEAIKAGAIDYIVKSPQTFTEMPRILVRTLREWRLLVERRRSEDQLRQSEERFRHIADQLLDVIYVTDMNGVITYISPASDRLFKLTPVEMIGRRFMDFLPPSEIPNAVAAFQSAIRNGHTSRELPLTMLRKDGSVFYGELNGSLFRLHDGTIGTMGLIRDVTERRLSDQIVVAQRTELAAIYENAPFIMLLLDKDRKVRKVNRLGAAFTDSREVDLLEKTGGEALGCIHALADSRGCGFCQHVEQCVLCMTLSDTFVTGTSHYMVEANMRLRINNTEQEATLLVSTTLLALGKKAMVLVTVTDITERRRLELETRHSQTKLIHANKMSSLGMLVSSVAHEVNNPNNFIMFNSSLLSNAWKDMAPVLDRFAAEDHVFRVAGLPYAEMREAVPRLLKGITEGSRRIKDMVDHLRALSRTDKSGLSGVIDVNAAVQSAMMILQNEVLKHTDAFTLELAGQLPRVTGSAQQIEQVVINLVHNALQSLRERSSAVSVCTVEDVDRGEVVIEVKDRGVGISPRDLQRIVEPFFTTKLDSGGTGLGLSISNSIIRDHHGRLDIESEEGKGTTVRVALPCNNEKL